MRWVKQSRRTPRQPVEQAIRSLLDELWEAGLRASLKKALQVPTGGPPSLAADRPRRPDRAAPPASGHFRREIAPWRRNSLKGLDEANSFATLSGVAKEFANASPGALSSVAPARERALARSAVTRRIALMPRPASAQPTEVEMQILRILWELGPSPVREIHKRLEAAKGTNYSTTVKMLAVMLQKGLRHAATRRPSRTSIGRSSPGPKPASGCSTT